MVAIVATDRILMGNTCELPRMGSRKYSSGHKSLLRDVSGAIDSPPTCEWRSNIYHLRINIMRLCFQTVESHRYSCLSCGSNRAASARDKIATPIFLRLFPILETYQRSSIAGNRSNWKTNETWSLCPLSLILVLISFRLPNVLATLIPGRANIHKLLRDDYDFEKPREARKLARDYRLKFFLVRLTFSTFFV